MSRKSNVELTNLCIIYKDDKLLVEEKIWKGKKGIIFPGGHIEEGESLQGSVIREIKEETGLTIENPIPFGFKDWIEDDGSRYLVILYKTDRFFGTLQSSEEGRVFGTTKEEFKKMDDVMWDMNKVLEIFESEVRTELFYERSNEKGILL